MCSGRKADLEDLIEQMDIAKDEEPKNASKFQAVIDYAEKEIKTIDSKNE